MVLLMHISLQFRFLVRSFIGYQNTGQTWRLPYVEPSKNYTDTDFLQDVDRLWEQMKPLYKQLHAYVRAKLREKYPHSYVRNDGPSPAHLLSKEYILFKIQP